MDMLTFISQLVHSLAWPVVVALFIWIIRIPLKDLISMFRNLKDFELKYKDLALTIQLKQEELKKELEIIKSEVGAEDDELIKEKIDSMLKKMESNSKTYIDCLQHGYGPKN